MVAQQEVILKITVVGKNDIDSCETYQNHRRLQARKRANYYRITPGHAKVCRLVQAAPCFPNLIADQKQAQANGAKEPQK